MTKEVPAFLRAEIGNDAADATQEPQNRMLGRLAQMRLEFAEGQLDRVEVRRTAPASREDSRRVIDHFVMVRVVDERGPAATSIAWIVKSASSGLKVAARLSPPDSIKH